MAQIEAEASQPPRHPRQQNTRVGVRWRAHRLQMRLDKRSGELFGDRQSDYHAAHAPGEHIDIFASGQRLPCPYLDMRRQLASRKAHAGDRSPRGYAGRAPERRFGAPRQRCQGQPRLGEHRREVRRRHRPHLVAGPLQPHPQCDVGLDTTAGVIAQDSDAHGVVSSWKISYPAISRAISGRSVSASLDRNSKCMGNEGLEPPTASV